MDGGSERRGLCCLVASGDVVAVSRSKKGRFCASDGGNTRDVEPEAFRNRSELEAVPGTGCNGDLWRSGLYRHSSKLRSQGVDALMKCYF